MWVIIRYNRKDTTNKDTYLTETQVTTQNEMHKQMLNLSVEDMLLTTANIACFHFTIFASESGDWISPDSFQYACSPCTCFSQWHDNEWDRRKRDTEGETKLCRATMTSPPGWTDGGGRKEDKKEVS
jgi:hypothetical protein